jgi:hypothetical protein
MEPSAAIRYLRTYCVPKDDSDEALLAEWKAASAKLGPAVTNAGYPSILPFPATHASYEKQVRQAWPTLFQSLRDVQLCMVEIEPLLAFQFHIDTDRSAHHCASLSKPPSTVELLATGLPLAQPDEPYQVLQQPQSIILKARNTNVVMGRRGILGNILGVTFGPTVPLLHVVRFNGRCYLQHGFHRVYGARLTGATHVPCVFRDVSDPDAIGIRRDGGTFGMQILESSNPPTLAHFTQHRAHRVALRAMHRVLHVSWAEWVMPSE